jgi:CheY-like chemotaxis protein
MAAAKAKPPALMVLDVEMPGMSGFAVVEKLAKALLTAPVTTLPITCGTPTRTSATIVA